MKEMSMEELIVTMKNSYKTKSYGSIYESVYVKEILYEFEEVKLFGGKMAIMLPLVFKDMPENIAKMKYPSRNRPQIIKTNMDGSINCCFSILEPEVTKEEILPFAEDMKKVILALQPKTFCSEVYQIKTENGIFGWFTHKNYSIDSEIFSHMFITEVDGHFLHGTFNCPYRDRELWEWVMRDMMLTVKDLTKIKTGGEE